MATVSLVSLCRSKLLFSNKFGGHDTVEKLLKVTITRGSGEPVSLT
jgi:hypothetical protein